jgi:hypothetical protein
MHAHCVHVSSQPSAAEMSADGTVPTIFQDEKQCNNHCFKNGESTALPSAPPFAPACTPSCVASSEPSGSQRCST